MRSARRGAGGGGRCSQTLCALAAVLCCMLSSESAECSALHSHTLLMLLFLVILQATPTDFVITGSVDGHLKFWKKQETGIEFVKHYRAHLGAVDGEGGLGGLPYC